MNKKQKDMEANALRAYADEELKTILAEAKSDHAANLSRYQSLAPDSAKVVHYLQNEVERRQAEADKWDEWGNYIGPENENPNNKKISWWRRKEFWKKVYSL